MRQLAERQLSALDFNDPQLDNEQILILSLIGVYTLVIMVLWKMPFLHWLLFPFKVMTVGLHEWGHAIVCTLTGGKVEEIQLDLKQGGVTITRGGAQRLMLPAGYLGSSLCGALLIMAAFDNFASKIASIVFAVIMLMVLWWASNYVARIIGLVFIVLVVALWFIEDGEGIRYVMLFLGVMSALYSIWDIMEDLILRKVNESDASKMAQKCGCCPARGWGIIWCFISILFLVGGILAGLVLF
jgi:Peptidase M50B-like